MNLTAEQVDKLVAAGRISPEVGEEMKKSTFGQVLTALSPVALYKARNTLQDANREASVADEAARVASLPQSPQAPQAQQVAPQSAAPAPRGVGDFGLGALQRGIAGAQEDTDDALSGAQGRMGAAYGLKKSAVTDLADLEAQKAAELASASRVQTQAVEAADAAAQKREAERQAHLEGVAQELRGLQKEARDYKINPDRRTAGQKVMGTIGAFLGGFGAGLLGSTHNQVLEAIQSDIANDIAAQREELAGKRAAIGDKMNELGVLRQRFGDERSAEDAFRVRKFETYKKQIEDLAGEYMAPEAQARLQDLMAGIDAEQAEREMRVISEQNNRFLQGAQAQAGIAGTRANIALQNQENAAKAAAAAPPGALVLPGGYVGVVTDKEVAKKAREQAGASSAVQRLIADIKAEVEKTGTQVLPTDAAAKIKTKGMVLQTALRASGGMGSLDKGTQEFLDAMIGGDLTGYRTDKVLAQLSGISESDQIMSDAKMEGFGFPRQQATPDEAKKAVGFTK